MKSRAYKEAVFHTPRPLAEYIEPEIAEAAVKLHETRSSPNGQLRSAWNHIEFGLNKNYDHSEDARRFCVETAEMLVGKILANPKSHQDTLLGGLVLGTYTPLFLKRSLDTPVERHDCEAVYKSLGAALKYLQPLETDEPPQWGMTEVSVLAFSARTRRPDLLLYPTSPREENSYAADFNHDSYYYLDNDKIPLQQKLFPTQKTYNEYVTILTLMPIVDKGLTAIEGVDKLSPSDKINYLLSLVIAETHGEKLKHEEVGFLNFMTEAVASHRHKNPLSQKAHTAV